MYDNTTESCGGVLRPLCEADKRWSGGGTNIKEQNMRAKRANLSEGRGAKPQVQNGWLGCRLDRVI